MSRKKPYWRKILEGNPGKHPLSPPGAPDLHPLKLKNPPLWLGKHGKKFYKRVAPELIRLGLLTELDEMAFELLCATYERARHTQELLIQEGLVAPDERKLPRKNPLWQIHRESVAQFFKMAAEFGLEPSGRAKLDITVIDPDEKESSKLSSLIK